MVIPVYGQWDLVKRNIDALLKFDRELIAEILAVNDCSPSKNPHVFDEDIVTIIENERNLGYTGTVNNGLRKSSSRIVVLLDSDAYPISPFIQKLTAMYESDQTIGSIGFATVDDDGNDTGNYQYESSILGLIAGQALEAKFGYLRFWRNRNILPNSCAVSFRKTCLEELGYFDEQNFPVLEADVDLSMRIHRSKWKQLFTREIVICHRGGYSYKIDYKRVSLFHRSKWSLLKKHGLLPFPALAKAAIKGRIRVELIMGKLMSITSSHDTSYAEKIKGRKILIKEVDSYN